MNKSKQPIESHQSNNRPRFNLFVSKPETSRLNVSTNSTNNNNKSVHAVNRTQLINAAKVSNTSAMPVRTIPLNKTVINRHSPNHINNSSTIKIQQTSSGQCDVSKDSKYQCQLCELNFYDIERLNFHLIKIHKLDHRINCLQCYVKGCEEKFRKRLQLVEHLNDVHQLSIMVVTKILSDLDEFIKWKDKLENETGYRWIQNNEFYLKNRLRKTFICNRPATNGCRVFSMSGATTINNHSTFCLSSIKVVEGEDGAFRIEFIGTHNHDE